MEVVKTIVDRCRLPWKAWLMTHHLNMSYIMIGLVIYSLLMGVSVYFVKDYQTQIAYLENLYEQQTMEMSLLDEWVHSTRYESILNESNREHSSLLTVSQRLLGEYPLTVVSQAEESGQLQIHLLGDPMMYIAYMDAAEKENPRLEVKTQSIRLENNMVHIYCQLAYR